MPENNLAKFQFRPARRDQRGEVTRKTARIFSLRLKSSRFGAFPLC
jgi:hypothetical protein